jgi:hypothetical protein
MRHFTLQVLPVHAAVSSAAESYKIPAAPDLIPDGPWKKVDGGVCAAKGFKATGMAYNRKRMRLAVKYSHILTFHQAGCNWSMSLSGCKHASL